MAEANRPRQECSRSFCREGLAGIKFRLAKGHRAPDAHGSEILASFCCRTIFRAGFVKRAPASVRQNNMATLVRH